MSEEVLYTITPPGSPTWLEIDKDVSQQDCQPDVEHYKKILTFRWFTCIGEAKLDKINLSEESYLQNNEINLFEDFEKDVLRNQCTEHKSVSLFNKKFDFASVFVYNCDTLFRLARSEILLLQDAAKLKHSGLYTLSDFHATQDHMKARQNCVRMFLCIREYISCLNLQTYSWVFDSIILNMEKNLNGFRLFLRRLSDLPEYVLHHSAHSQGNKCMEASYHLFHCHLDMLWLHLTTVYLTDKCRRLTEKPASQHSEESSITSTAVTLDQALLAVVADLVQLAVVRFEKIDVRSLLIKSPFHCNCVAELWILLQVFTNRLHAKGLCDNFWSLVNKVLEPFLSSNGRPQRKPNCRSLTQSVSRLCANVHAFTLWFFKHTAMLYTYEDQISCSNYCLLEAVVKGLLSTDVSEAQMRVYLTFIEKIIIKYWEPKTETIILLWEYFQKRLNSTFYVPGSSIDSMAIVSESVAGMVKQVKSRLSSNSSCDNSFQMFLRILGLYLQRVSGQNQHWNQIRGRIYSKLSASKVQALNETGLYHLVTLFLTLAITADPSEVCKKLQSLLDYLPHADLDTGVWRLVWRTRLSVCLLFAERNQDFNFALAPLTSALGQQQLDVSLYRTFFDGLKDILDCSPSLKIDYSILIGSWIPKYLADCSPNDSSRLLETLNILILRVQSQPLDQDRFQSNLWQYLSPHMRQKVSEENSSPQLADICLHLCQLSQPHSDTLKEIVQLFLNNNTASISLVRRFLWKLVQNNELLALLKMAQAGSPESHEVLIIKGWIRCSLLSQDFNSSELSRVTNYILYLPFMAGICMDLPSAADPLKHFIVAVSNKFKATKDICQRGSLRQLMSRFFTGMDKWVEPHVKQPRSQDILGRIYHVVGLIFSLMPSFIYLKSRPNTVLKGLLDVMFLPMSAYKPDFEPNPQLKAVIAADIHLYINGLADLGMMQDVYIDRCLQDLIKIYLPCVAGHSQCKMQECVERGDNSAKLILNTVCLAFIKRKTSSPHPHCSQALQFLLSTVKLYSRNSRVMLLLVDTCCEHVCDVIMFCDDFHHAKNIARDVMVHIFESYCFGDQISEKIVQKFDNLCRDYLPFLPKKLFGLYLEVLKHRPELVLRYLPALQNHVKIVEAKRGINHDHSLRVYMAELENALKKIRKGPEL